MSRDLSRAGALKRAMGRRTAAATTMMCSVAVLQFAQSTTFRSGADVVSVYATVTDRRGAAVTGLTTDDFRIYEDGKLRPLTIVSSDPQPFSAVVVLDFSGSMRAFRSDICDGALAFVRRLMPNDRVRFGGFAAGQIWLVPRHFTDQTAELDDSVAALRAGQLRNRIPFDVMPSASGSAVWQTVEAGLDSLKDEAARKVVVLFSDGLDTDYDNARQRLGRIRTRLQRDRVTIYALGFTPSPRDGGVPPPGVPPGTEVMSSLSRESGGAFFSMKPQKSDFDAVFSRVADDLHTQYLLGFVPANRDGKAHRIDVVTASRANVRARTSYIATP